VPLAFNCFQSCAQTSAQAFSSSALRTECGTLLMECRLSHLASRNDDPGA